MSGRTLLSLTLLFGFTSCATSEEPDEVSPLIEPCLDACGKIACVADGESNCELYCERAAEIASEQGGECSRDLQVLFECQAELSCLEYEKWYSEVPDARCADAEAIAVQSCPDEVQLR